jgi:hypothetical protein
MYTITTSDFIYYITNLSQEQELKIVVEKKSCESVGWVQVESTLIATISSYEIDYLVNDSYRILFYEQETLLDIVYIKNYYTLLQNITEDLKKVFCESCSSCCNSCNSTTNCDLLLNAYAKVEQFKRLMSPQITPFLLEVYKYTDCYTKEILDCHTEGELLHGKYLSSEHIITKLLAYDYIAIYLYFKEITTNNDLIESFENIEELINFNEIICCIEKVTGILVSDINKVSATFTINTVFTGNLPPNQVGDYTLEVNTSTGGYVLTTGMFTNLTTPAYQDPEGDAPFAVRIDSLPTEGTLLYDGVNVVVGQEILFSDVDSGMLMYAVNTNLEQNNITTFNFSVSDTGSEQFSS